MLFELKNIRKKICLEQIDYSTAVKQIDLVMHGLKLGDVLDPQIKDVLHSHNLVVDQYNSFMKDLKVLKEIIKDENKQYTDDEKTTIEALLLSLKNKTAGLRTAQEHSRKYETSLSNHIKFIKSYYSDLAKEIKKLLNDVETSGNKIELAAEETEKELSQLQDKLK